MRSSAAGLLLAGCKDQAPSFKSTDITGADYGKSLTLTDVEQRQADLAGGLPRQAGAASSSASPIARTSARPRC